MFGGGEITFDKYRPVTNNNSHDDKIQTDELVFKDGDQEITGDKLSNNQLINFNGKTVLFGALKQAVIGTSSTTAALKALEPRKMMENFGDAKKQEATQVFGEIQQLQTLIEGGESGATVKVENLENPSGEQVVVTKNSGKAALTARKEKLTQLITQIQAANRGAGKQVTEGIDPAWTGLVGSQTGKDAGSDGDKKQLGSVQYQLAGPGSGVSGGQTGGAVGGGGAPSSGAPAMFNNMPPFSVASYAAGLYADSQIADGIGQLGKSRAEGQKLMMLFMYYARMAMSGDLGAMYQLMQFLNYIISKDKARQNIQISSKLIQLQDLSRKATETLMSTSTEGKSDKEINEFTKALHKAKSQESTIATSQKLLADMLQEMGHVTEAMTNSAKFMLDAWGRNLRTSTRA